MKENIELVYVYRLLVPIFIHICRLQFFNWFLFLRIHFKRLLHSLNPANQVWPNEHDFKILQCQMWYYSDGPEYYCEERGIGNITLTCYITLY